MLNNTDQTLTALLLYVLPLNSNGHPNPEYELMMQELLNGRPLFDIKSYSIPDGEHIIVFFDDDYTKTHKVIKAFLGRWEFIGRTLDFDASFGYKFTPIEEVDAFLKKEEFLGICADQILIPYKLRD